MHLKFRPYVGDQYRIGYTKGIRLLIVGESHYDDFERGAETTNHWLTRHAESESPGRFWSMVEAIVAGQVLEGAGRTSFWRKVAFANAVQEVLNFGERPSSDQWKTVRQAFVELLVDGHLKPRPNLIFVFGNGVWTRLPDESEFKSSHSLPNLQSPNGHAAYLYQFENESKALAGCFNHPRSLRRPLKTWQAFSKRLLREAMSIVGS